MSAQGNLQRVHVSDAATGAYNGVINATNPGPRPPRPGVWTPEYFFAGTRPASDDWRKELARLVTTDRQFARAAVNYVWAYLFRLGIVDPPEGWDLDRVDPDRPPPGPWTLQPSHPELLDALADDFIRSGYRFRPLARLLTFRPEYAATSRSRRRGASGRKSFTTRWQRPRPRRRRSPSPAASRCGAPSSCPIPSSRTATDAGTRSGTS